MMNIFLVWIIILIGTKSTAKIEELNSGGVLQSLGLKSNIVHDIDGNLYVVSKNDYGVSARLKEKGQWERPLINFVINNVLNRSESEQKKIIRVLDIGGHCGTWTIPIAKFFNENAIIFTFEAQPELHRMLVSSLLLNHITTVSAVNAIVTNISFGSRNLYAINDQGNTGSYSIDMLTKPITNTLSNPVRQITMDHYYFHEMNLSLSDCPTFIKLDIERHEIYALLGMKSILLNCNPILIIEANCAQLSKSLFYLLDLFMYDIAWIVLPTEETTIVSKDGTMPILPYDGITNNDYVYMEYGSSNILAMKRPNSQAFFKLYPDVLYPIHVDRSNRNSSRTYDIIEENIALCDRYHRCGILQHDFTILKPCDGSDIDPFLSNLWKLFVKS